MAVQDQQGAGGARGRRGANVSGRRVLAALALAILLVAGAVAVWGRLAPPVPGARERMRDKALPTALRFL